MTTPDPRFEAGIQYGKLYLPGIDRPITLGPNGITPKGFCHNCGNKIRIQIFLGERYCSDNCRKALGEDIE